MFGALGAVVGYIFRIHEGREFLEQPLWVKLAIIVAALIFLYNVTMTVLRGPNTAITNVLLLGMFGHRDVLLFALYNPGQPRHRQDILVVCRPSLGRRRLGAGDGRRPRIHHHKLTGVDREVIDKWLYAIVGALLFSGLLGTGHHYYWIGTPALLAVGRYDLLEPRNPAIFRHGFVHLLHGLEAQAGSPQQCGAVLGARMRGARLFWGWRVGLHAYVPGINYYTHGTQVTAAHAHLAFFGAYVC